MNKTDSYSPSKTVEHLFREQSGRMSSVLTRVFGFHNSELVDDIIQETFIAAMKTWPLKGEPEEPVAWLMTVAKNKLLNELKRLKRSEKKHQALVDYQTEEQIDELFLDHEIKDSQLRTLFACCNPNLKPKVKIMLTLKIVSGFSDAVIANALLMSEHAVKKSIFRAKQLLRNSGETLQIPFVPEVENRFETALTVIYLIFNEGYKSSHGALVFNEEICEEAIKLGLLLESVPNIEQGKLFALLALMHFNVARLDTRLNDFGEIENFENQNRLKWDRNLIKAGVYYLRKSRVSTSLSEYHLEATIASAHALASHYKETDWKLIVSCYRMLLKLQETDLTKLNYAIALSKLDGPAAGLKILAEIEESEPFQSLYFAAKAEMNLSAENYDKAKTYYSVALDYITNDAERDFIQKKIQECDKHNYLSN